MIDELIVSEVEMDERNNRIVNFYEKMWSRSFAREERFKIGKDYPILKRRLMSDAKRKIADYMYLLHYHSQSHDHFPSAVLIMSCCLRLQRFLTELMIV